MSSGVLDERARRLLREVKPGDRITVCGERAVMEVAECRHPVEAEPYLKCWELSGRQGAWIRQRARFFRISRVYAIVKE